MSGSIVRQTGDEHFAVLDALERFEENWQSPSPVSLARFWQDTLTSQPRLDAAGRRELLLQLIHIDLEYRWRRSRGVQVRGSAAADAVLPDPAVTIEQWRLQDYVRHFPELGLAEAIPTDLILQEYRCRRRAGDQPAHAAYLAEWPHAASDLEAGFEQADRDLAAESAGHSSVGEVGTVDDRAGSQDTGDGAKVTAKRQGTSAPGRVAGYEILGELGRGGMGVVYKARQQGLNRLVALKMILAGSHAAPHHVSRFRTEAEAVARLVHPNIVQIHEIGEHESLPYFSLEFVEGGSLAEQLRGAPQNSHSAAQLGETLARAVDAAHQQGIVHRDLKPANVLLMRDGTPKISDFGLAKKIDEAGQTATGDILGTPSYMAPEQADGRVKEFGPLTDVYALGAILYELLTGRPPFRGESVLDTLELVRSQEPVPPRQLQPKVPRDLETICLKCLQKEPRKRYASAAALAEDLRHFQAGEPILARPVGRIERGYRWCQRNPRLAFASGLAAAGLLSVTVLAIVFGLYERTMAGQLKVAGENLQKKQQETAAALVEAKRQSAWNAFAQGVTLCEKGDEARGLLWLARSLQEAPEDDAILQSVIRTNLDGWSRAIRPLRGAFSHQAGIQAFIASPDGTTVLTTSDDHTARLWDAVTGEPRSVPLRHDGLVVNGAFSPDGRTVVTASNDHTARLWDAATGQPVGEPLRHRGGVMPVAFSPDGKTVLTGSYDHAARLWDAATGRPLGAAMEHRGQVSNVAFSRDGKTVLTASSDASARFWDARTGKPLGPPLSQPVMSAAVAFAPDGKSVVAGDVYGTVRRWEVPSWRSIGPPAQHGSRIRALVLSPDGKCALVSGGRSARLWDLDTGKARGEPMQHAGEVWAMAFSPDGTRALTGSFDQTLQLWDAHSGKAVGSPILCDGIVRTASFSPDGRMILAAGHSHTARLWDANTRLALAAVLRHQGAVSVVAFSPDGTTILTGSADHTARLWSASTGKPQGPPLQHNGPVMKGTFCPDGKTAITAGADNTTRRWDAATGQPLGPPLHHGKMIIVRCFSADSRTALTTGVDATNTSARLWDLTTGKQLSADFRHNGVVQAGAISPDGKTVLTGSSDRTARLWDAATGRPLCAPLEHGSGIVFSVAFSPDSTMALTGGMDHSARLWDAATGQPLATPMQHEGIVRAVLFSPDGKTILTGSMDQTARLWDAQTGKPLGAPLRHKGEVQALAFSPDGRTILTGGSDGSRLWDAATGQPLGPRLHAGEVQTVAFAPDGRTALSGNADGTACVWTVPTAMPGAPESVLGWAQTLTGMQLDTTGAAYLLPCEAWYDGKKQGLDGADQPTGNVPAVR